METLCVPLVREIAGWLCFSDRLSFGKTCRRHSAILFSCDRHAKQVKRIKKSAQRTNLRWIKTLYLKEAIKDNDWPVYSALLSRAVERENGYAIGRAAYYVTRYARKSMFDYFEVLLPHSHGPIDLNFTWLQMAAWGAARRGDIELTKALAARTKNDTLLYPRVFAEAAKGGHLEIARWAGSQATGQGNVTGLGREWFVAPAVKGRCRAIADYAIDELRLHPFTGVMEAVEMKSPKEAVEWLAYLHGKCRTGKFLLHDEVSLWSEAIQEAERLGNVDAADYILTHHGAEGDGASLRLAMVCGITSGFRFERMVQMAPLINPFLSCGPQETAWDVWLQMAGQSIILEVWYDAKWGESRRQAVLLQKSQRLVKYLANKGAHDFDGTTLRGWECLSQDLDLERTLHRLDDSPEKKAAHKWAKSKEKAIDCLRSFVATCVEAGAQKFEKTLSALQKDEDWSLLIEQIFSSTPGK